MEVKAYFENIENIIINELMFARKSIKIAVAWFTDAEFIPYLVRKVKGGVSVEILLHHDDINHLGDNSIDFSDFTEVGGKLAWCKSIHSVMHEKFCIIDDEVLIEGTFNWTYYAENRNDEHIIVFKDFPELLKQFIERYESLKKKYAVSTSENLQSHSEIKLITPLQSNRERNRHLLEEFRAKLESIDKQGKTKDYIDVFYKFWTRRDSGKYLFDLEEFDIQQKFIEFEEEYQEQKQREYLQKKTNSLREKFSYVVPEITNPALRYTNEFYEIQEKLNAISDKFKGISASKVRKNYTIWNYLKSAGVPFVVDKEHWYDSIFNPVKFNKYADCIGYSLDSTGNKRKYIRKIKDIEDEFNLRLIVTDDLQQPESFDFARERSLYIQMMEKGYSPKLIQEHLCEVKYGRVDLHCHLGDTLYTISTDQLTRIAVV